MKSDRGIKLLTHAEVCEIRNNPHRKTGKQFAEEFGITPSAVSWVKTYRSYKHVNCN